MNKIKSLVRNFNWEYFIILFLATPIGVTGWILLIVGATTSNLILVWVGLGIITLSFLVWGGYTVTNKILKRNSDEREYK